MDYTDIKAGVLNVAGAAAEEEERNLRRVSYLQATKEERMETEEK